MISQHFAQEAKAVAEAIRHIRGQVAFLVLVGELTRQDDASVCTIMDTAAELALAIECLAQRTRPDDDV